MKVRVYMLVDNLPIIDPMYAMLVVFEVRWMLPFFCANFQDGTTVISEHLSRDKAAEILRHWRANKNLNLTMTR